MEAGEQHGSTAKRPGGGTAWPRLREVQTEGQPRVRTRLLPGTRQGRPRGTRSRPRTEKNPLGSRSRTSPPPTSTTVPCIHTAVSSSGSRPAAARDKRHEPGPPSASRRSCSASTLSGGNRGSLTAVGPLLGNDSVGAAILPRLSFPANFDEREARSAATNQRRASGVGQWSGPGGGAARPSGPTPPPQHRSAHAYVK